MTSRWLRRPVHPVAWWIWAIGLVAAATRTLNPLLLLGIIGVAALVVAARRSDSPWSASFKAFLFLGAIVLTIRVLFEVLFGPPIAGTVVATLPTLTLPDVMAGVRLGGPVTAEALLAAVYQGLQLVAILACVGAANSLANPTRLLKSVPGALYEVGVALVVALTLVPTAMTHVQRVREARRLRGRPDSGLRALTTITTTVLTGSLERAIDMAAAMDSRGYGRMRHVPRRQRQLTAAVVLTGLVALLVGSFGLLDAQTPGWAAILTVLVGATIAVVGLRRANRRAIRTVYRPDPWRVAEWLTTISGVVPAIAFAVAGMVSPALLMPSTSPLTWPSLPILPVIALLVAAAPAFVTPRPPLPDVGTDRAEPRVELSPAVAA
jgi:energy-coupling factor transport system permease protein